MFQDRARNEEAGPQDQHQPAEKEVNTTENEAHLHPQVQLLFQGGTINTKFSI